MAVFLMSSRFIVFMLFGNTLGWCVRRYAFLPDRRDRLTSYPLLARGTTQSSLSVEP